MEPDSTGKAADLVGTEVTSDDEPAEAIRWIGDVRPLDHHTLDEHDEHGEHSSTDDDAVDVDSNGNGSANVEQLELDESMARDDDDDDDDDHDDDDTATRAETSNPGPALITISGGRSPDLTTVKSRELDAQDRDIQDRDIQDSDDWDDDEEEDWDDDEWDGAAVATDRYPAPARADHLTFVDVLRVRSARFLVITMVVTFVAVVMATVLLWQRVEDTRAEVDRSRQITSVPGLASVHRRLNRLETEIAAILGSPNGDPTGRADAIQQQLTTLNQCVADFQRAVVTGKRSAVRYC